MNAKTKARMRRIACVLDRITRQLDRELKAQTKLGHPKAEDVHAAEGLRTLRDSAEALGREVAQPRQTEIPIP